MKKNLPMFQGINAKYGEETVTLEKRFQNRDANDSMKRFEDFSSIWRDDTLVDDIEFNNTDLIRHSNAYKEESFSFKKSSKLLKSEETEEKKKWETEKNSRLVSDMKRRAALEEKWNSIKEKKNLIKNALKNTPKDSETQRNHSKITLFDDESSEEDKFEPNFEVKSYLDGDKGLKRLNLIAKLACDERFKIDERFFDDDENEAKNIDNSKKNQSLFGTIKRYDPSKSVLTTSHASPTQTEQKMKKMKAKSIKVKQRREIPTAKPEISKDRYYSVSDNLKDAFRRSDTETAFSLSAMFNEKIKQDERNNCREKESNLMTFPKKFEYIENSLENLIAPDDEDVDEEDEAPLDILFSAVPAEKILGKCGVWGETFFFKPDDSRLKASFYQSSEPDENKDFGKRRKQLRSIVKKRIQNSRRDKKIFKRKLGGKLNRTKFKMRLKKVHFD